MPFFKKYYQSVRSSLKLIDVAGEPMTHEAWEWMHHVVGEERCDIVDTWYVNANKYLPTYGNMEAHT